MSQAVADHSTDPAAWLAELAGVRGRLEQAIAARVVGQEHTIDALLTAIFARGHALLVGPPGVAKTLLVRTVADALGWSFKRIQFTPDLMPSDITGTEVLREDKASGARSFAFVPGPVFANLVLADEINRTTPKTQAALLEAMQEGLVTAGGVTHALPRPFFVLATQNPIEQEGTYRLPEAQLDRFLVSIQVGYPDAVEERAIALIDTIERPPVEAVLALERFTVLSRAIAALPVPPVAVDYAVRLTRATRPDGDAPEWVRSHIAWGCGPRATQHLIAAARAHAALAGRAAAACDDVAAVAPWVLAHRLVPTFQALGKGTTPASLVATLLKQVAP
jgi:MoxR-like ATPase